MHCPLKLLVGLGLSLIIIIRKAREASLIVFLGSFSVVHNYSKISKTRYPLLVGYLATLPTYSEHAIISLQQRLLDFLSTISPPK